MAHNIQILTDGTECFVENGSEERAWHGLGQVYDRPLTAIEALKGCHADWNVEERGIYYPNADFGKILMENPTMTAQEFMAYLTKIDSHKGIVRNDNNFNLGVVGKGYGMVQNAEAFEFVDLLTNGKVGNATIECAGVLGNGERIFITAKFPQVVRIGSKDDIIEQYIVFTTSHDGSGAVTCLVAPTRVVCQNTLNFALKHNSGKLYFKHTCNVSKRMDLTNKENAEMAYKVLNLQDTYTKFFAESLEQLGNIRLTDKQTEELLVSAVLTPDVQKIYFESGNNLNCEDIPTRSRNMITSITEACHGGIGQEYLDKGTGLWLVNGLTTYYQNNFDWKDNERKFDAIIGGSVEGKLQKLHSNLLKIA